MPYINVQNSINHMIGSIKKTLSGGKKTNENKNWNMFNYGAIDDRLYLSNRDSIR